MRKPQVRTSDLIGRRFGRLFVDRLGEKDKNGHRSVLCICDCGTERAIKAFCLVQGMTRSCGCLRNEIGVENLGHRRAS